MWISNALISVLRLLIGVTARWESPPDLTRQRIYFANHTSHMDTLAIIAALPPEARLNVKPIAAADYWGKNRFLSYISQKGLNAVLIDRKPAPGKNALEPIFDVVQAGHSIIFFPEGTRSSEALPGNSNQVFSGWPRPSPMSTWCRSTWKTFIAPCPKANTSLCRSSARSVSAIRWKGLLARINRCFWNARNAIVGLSK